MNNDQPPLTLYVHWPWCLRKCAYCDFNSYPAMQPAEQDYLAAVLDDLDNELALLAAPRVLQSVFIGGGTPSLISSAGVQTLLDGIRARAVLVADAEVTLEANPGALSQAQCAGYVAAGVNRLSFGVQSFSEHALRRLGRIHTPAQAVQAVQMARRAGCTNINIDLMYGLPGQTRRAARQDLKHALALAPEHIAYYQLTLEPQTPLGKAPPIDRAPEEQLAALHDQGIATLTAAGYQHYEISAYARPGQQCRHNLNYWHFGDYLGIGAGAHGKITDCTTGEVRRRVKHANPARYITAATRCALEQRLTATERVLEFALNALRLRHGVPMTLFAERTGLASNAITAACARAQAAGLLISDEQTLGATALGWRFLDDLLQYFVLEC